MSDAVGDVMRTKKMMTEITNSYFKVKENTNFHKTYKNDKTGCQCGVVLPDQDLQNLVLPEAGDKVHVWDSG